MRQPFIFLLGRSGFWFRSCPMDTILPSVFPIVKSWTLALSKANDALCWLDVSLGSFVTFWKTNQCAVGGGLVGWLPLGRINIIQRFHHLEIMDHDAGVYTNSSIWIAGWCVDSHESKGQSRQSSWSDRAARSGLSLFFFSFYTEVCLLSVQTVVHTQKSDLY